jgi:hypothetical protein
MANILKGRGRAVPAQGHALQRTRETDGRSSGRSLPERQCIDLDATAGVTDRHRPVTMSVSEGKPEVIDGGPNRRD